MHRTLILALFSAVGLGSCKEPAADSGAAADSGEDTAGDTDTDTDTTGDTDTGGDTDTDTGGDTDPDPATGSVQVVLAVDISNSWHEENFLGARAAVKLTLARWMTSAA